MAPKKKKALQEPKTPRNPRSRRKRSSDPNRIVCDMRHCGKWFPSKFALSTHILDMHLSKRAANQASYTCEWKGCAEKKGPLKDAAWSGPAKAHDSKSWSATRLYNHITEAHVDGFDQDGDEEEVENESEQEEEQVNEDDEQGDAPAEPDVPHQPAGEGPKRQRTEIARVPVRFTEEYIGGRSRVLLLKDYDQTEEWWADRPPNFLEGETPFFETVVSNSIKVDMINGARFNNPRPPPPAAQPPSPFKTAVDFLKAAPNALITMASNQLGIGANSPRPAPRPAPSTTGAHIPLPGPDFWEQRRQRWRLTSPDRELQDAAAKAYKGLSERQRTLTGGLLAKVVGNARVQKPAKKGRAKEIMRVRTADH